MCKRAAGEELQALRLRVTDLQQAKEQAEASSRAKWLLVCKIAHELKAPLNAIVGFAQLARHERQRDDPDQPLPDDWAERIARAGWHMADVIDTLMSLGPLADGRLRASGEVLDLVRTLDDALRLVEPAARRRGIRVDVRAPAPAWVRADACGLRQVLVNLLSNAVKYNVDAGWIHVSVDGGDAVEVAVRDSGPGLSEAQCARLFRPFERLGAERTAVAGHGLGLLICKELVEAMGGAIRVDSRPGGGCAFSVTLPGVTPHAA